MAMALAMHRLGSLCDVILFLSFISVLRMGNYIFSIRSRSHLNYRNGNPRSTDDEKVSEDSTASNRYGNDGEASSFCQRLSNLNSIPLVPHVNKSIPTFTDADLDHQRLLERLRDYGLQEERMSGDGNCQFRAISDQLYGTPEKHKSVRKQVVYQLKAHEDLYKEYVPMHYDEYLRKIGRLGEWGDHVTLQAAADSFGMKIWLVTSFKDTTCIEITPKTRKENDDIFLSFWAEVHYNSLYEIPGAGSVLPSTPKKKHWMF